MTTRGVRAPGPHPRTRDGRAMTRAGEAGHGAQSSKGSPRQQNGDFVRVRREGRQQVSGGDGREDARGAGDHLGGGAGRR